MAIFQVRDLAAARRRVADLGVRVVWIAGLPGSGPQVIGGVRFAGEEG